MKIGTHQSRSQASPPTGNEARYIHSRARNWKLWEWEVPNRRSDNFHPKFLHWLIFGGSVHQWKLDMASGNILVPKCRSRSGHEKDTCELSCQKIRRHSGKSRMIRRRGTRSSGMVVIGEELEFQCECGNAATLKIFHAFKFCCSMVMTIFLLDKNFPIYSNALQIVSVLTDICVW